MDFKDKERKLNPRENSNPLSTLFFWWLNPLFRRGAKQDLTINDLYDVLLEDESKRVGDAVSNAWNEQIRKGKLQPGYRPRLYKALLLVFKSSYLLTVIGLAIDELVIRVAQPLFLKYLILSFSDGSSTAVQYWYAAGVCITTLVHMLILHPTMFSLQHIGMKCRVASCSMIYRKSLELSKAGQGKTTVGQMINLMGNDVIRFDTNLLFLAYLVLGPIQLAIFTYFLWDEVQYAAFGGVGCVILLIPLEYWIGKLFTRNRFHIAKRTDERARVMNEIIIAMRVIKMYAWEKPFSALVNGLRKNEVKFLKKNAFLRAMYLSLYMSSSKVVTYAIFLTYILTDNTLTADKVFFVLPIFNTVRQVMISYFPTAAAAIGELFVSMNRIETFLLLDSQDLTSSPHYKLMSPPTLDQVDSKKVQASIQMQNAEGRWVDDKIALNDINLDVREGQLVIVIGTVGSGKTSLLHAILGEIPITSGICKVSGKAAYASQEPWIFGGSVQQNILFGNDFDESRYEEVVRVSALEDDFKQLPHGDQTICGDRGVALSGGQKARVNLARCLYQKADIYLLDDPLSAVDARVSRHIFEKCIKEHLKGFLVILCTHQLQYLPQTDYVVVLEEGNVKAQGTYQELTDKGLDLMSLIATDTVDGLERKVSVIQKPEESQKDKKQESDGKGATATAEKMAGGSVTWSTYWEFLKMGGNGGVFLLFVSFLTSQLAFLIADWWLTLWTTAEGKRIDRLKSTSAPTTTPSSAFYYYSIEELGNSNLSGTLKHTWTPKDDDGYEGEDFYLWVYSGMVVAVLVLTQFRAIHFFLFCIKVSINMHNKMFMSLVRAPVKFFDENPSGRVMNRFTKDLGAMDELLPYSFFDAITIFLLMVSMVILIIISNYYMSIPTGILVVGLFVIRAYFIKTARDVKRIDAVARSPIFTHVAASALGLTTIRSCGPKVKGILCDQFDKHQDLHSSAWYTFIACNRWFGIWLEVMSVVYLSIVTLSFLILSALTSYSSSDVGLAISSAMSLTGIFQWGMRQSAETENLMTSVERALEYCKLEPEAPLESEPEKKPPKDWPKHGEIQFKDYYLAYEEKDVVKGLNLTIKGKEKIGIVGRTGAGKSSIIAGLFRMTEPRGDLIIDGIRANDIGLHDVRQNISIIPQDPVLFSGTMRYNLDPFDQFKDDELWRVLEEVELREAVSDLDMKVSDGGSNFSVGQRQLVCLGRALLRKNKIIVMDEATANVDPRTDKFIQTTIRSKFSECTILTIAHRLNSVMDCDKILVLDNGYMKEYDHPHKLLQNPNGYLSSMVQHTGKSSEAILRKMAADTYFGRRASFQKSNVEDIRSSISPSISESGSSDEDEEMDLEYHRISRPSLQ